MLTHVRHALRVLSRNRGFAAAAILSMALGIAAVTAVLSLAYTLLLRPLPVPRPHDVVSMYSASKTTGGLSSLSMPDYRDLAARDDVFEAVGAYVRLPILLDDGDGSERVYVEVATGSYHGLLRLQPAIGRLITPDDDRPGAPKVAVLNHAMWRHRFGANPGVIGRVVRINGHPVEIVGVAPEVFRGILLDWGGAPDLWLPMSSLRDLSPAFAGADVEGNRGAPWLQVVARLRDGMTARLADAAVRAQADLLAEAYPQTNEDRTFTVMPTSRARFWPGRRAEAIDLSGTLLVAVGILLAIAILNVANLQLARVMGRRRELSLRVAIGATPGRIVRQLLVENLVLAWVAALLSVPLMLLMTGMIARMDLPLFVSSRSLDLAPDWRIFVIVATLSTVSGLLLGSAPAWRAWRTDLRTGMNATPGARRTLFGMWDLRHTLAAAQVAIVVMLALGAGLLSKSLIGLIRTDLGFSPARVMLFGLDTSLLESQDPARAFARSRDLLARLRELSGVEAAALAHNVLPTPIRSLKEIVVPEADDSDARGGMSVHHNVVTPGYFETLRMPLVSGRPFTEADSQTPSAAIVNELLARRLWGDPARALGQRVQVKGETTAREIVGVTRDAVYREIDEAPLPYLFLPYDPEWHGALTLHVRSDRASATLIEEVRRELRRRDPALAFAGIRSMSDHVASRRAGSSLAAYLALAASIAGLALAVMGLYAVLAYLVSQRRTELAIRMSVGAAPNQILGFVLRVALRITSVGLIAGVAGSIVSTHLIASQLRGVSPGDAVVYLLVLGVVLCAVLAACLVPARRAARLEPWAVLREP